MFNVKNLNVTLGSTPILKNLCFSTPQEGVFGIFGKNGAGKTTLLRALAGLISYEGNVDFQNKCLKKYCLKTLKKMRAYQPAQSFLAWDLKVSDVFEIGVKKSPFMKQQKNELLEAFHMTSFLNIPFSTLSTGQKAKIFFMRSLLQDTPMLILDEPFAHFDKAAREMGLKILNDYTQKERLVLVSSHHSLDIEMLSHDKIILT